MKLSRASYVQSLSQSRALKQATRQGRRLVWSWCLIRHTSLAHARWRTSKSHGVVALPLPRAASSQQRFHHSLHLHFIRSQSILQSSFLLPARIPATNLCIRAAITPPTQSTHSSRDVPIRTKSYLLSPRQPLTRNLSHAAYQGRSFFWPQLSWAQRLPPSFRRSSEQTFWRHGKQAPGDSGLEQLRCEICIV